MSYLMPDSPRKTIKVIINTPKSLNISSKHCSDSVEEKLHEPSSLPSPSATGPPSPYADTGHVQQQHTKVSTVTESPAVIKVKRPSSNVVTFEESSMSNDNLVNIIHDSDRVDRDMSSPHLITVGGASVQASINVAAQDTDLAVAASCALSKHDRAHIDEFLDGSAEATRPVIPPTRISLNHHGSSGSNTGVIPSYSQENGRNIRDLSLVEAQRRILEMQEQYMMQQRSFFAQQQDAHVTETRLHTQHLRMLQQQQLEWLKTTSQQSSGRSNDTGNIDSCHCKQLSPTKDKISSDVKVKSTGAEASDIREGRGSDGVPSVRFNEKKAASLQSSRKIMDRPRDASSPIRRTKSRSRSPKACPSALRDCRAIGDGASETEILHRSSPRSSNKATTMKNKKKGSFLDVITSASNYDDDTKSIETTRNHQKVNLGRDTSIEDEVDYTTRSIQRNSELFNSDQNETLKKMQAMRSQIQYAEEEQLRLATRLASRPAPLDAYLQARELRSQQESTDHKTVPVSEKTDLPESMAIHGVPLSEYLEFHKCYEYYTGQKDEIALIKRNREQMEAEIARQQESCNAQSGDAAVSEFISEVLYDEDEVERMLNPGRVKRVVAKVLNDVSVKVTPNGRRGGLLTKGKGLQGVNNNSSKGGTVVKSKGKTAATFPEKKKKKVTVTATKPKKSTSTVNTYWPHAPPPGNLSMVDFVPRSKGFGAYRGPSLDTEYLRHVYGRHLVDSDATTTLPMKAPYLRFSSVPPPVATRIAVPAWKPKQTNDLARPMFERRAPPSPTQIRKKPRSKAVQTTSLRITRVLSSDSASEFSCGDNNNDFNVDKGTSPMKMLPVESKKTSVGIQLSPSRKGSSTLPSRRVIRLSEQVLPGVNVDGVKTIDHGVSPTLPNNENASDAREKSLSPQPKTHVINYLTVNEDDNVGSDEMFVEENTEVASTKDDDPYSLESSLIKIDGEPQIPVSIKVDIAPRGGGATVVLNNVNDDADSDVENVRRSHAQELQRSALEWIRAELMSRLVSSHSAFVDGNAEHHHIGDSTVQNRDTDTVEVVGADGLQAFVDHGLQIDDNIVTTLVRDMLLERAKGVAREQSTAISVNESDFEVATEFDPASVSLISNDPSLDVPASLIDERGNSSIEVPSVHGQFSAFQQRGDGDASPETVSTPVRSVISQSSADTSFSQSPSSVSITGMPTPVEVRDVNTSPVHMTPKNLFTDVATSVTPESSRTDSVFSSPTVVSDSPQKQVSIGTSTTPLRSPIPDPSVSSPVPSPPKITIVTPIQRAQPVDTSSTWTTSSSFLSSTVSTDFPISEGEYLLGQPMASYRNPLYIATDLVDDLDVADLSDLVRAEFIYPSDISKSTASHGNESAMNDDTPNDNISQFGSDISEGQVGWPKVPSKLPSNISRHVDNDVSEGEFIPSHPSDDDETESNEPSRKILLNDDDDNESEGLLVHHGHRRIHVMPSQHQRSDNSDTSTGGDISFG